MPRNRSGEFALRDPTIPPLHPRPVLALLKNILSRTVRVCFVVYVRVCAACDMQSVRCVWVFGGAQEQWPSWRVCESVCDAHTTSLNANQAVYHCVCGVRHNKRRHRGLMGQGCGAALCTTSKLIYKAMKRPIAHHNCADLKRVAVCTHTHTGTRSQITRDAHTHTTESHVVQLHRYYTVLNVMHDETAYTI